MTASPWADLTAEVARLQGLPAAIGADLATLGGVLRCGKCGTEQPLGDTGHHVAHGWPSCCGLAMTWVTRRELSREARQPSPEGFRLEAVPDSGLGAQWILDSAVRFCRWTENRKSCGRPAVAVLLRGQTKRPYGYCPDHMYGRWVQDGVVMCWVLRPDD